VTLAKSGRARIRSSFVGVPSLFSSFTIFPDSDTCSPPGMANMRLS
jgi:hypothetical protein